MTLIEMGVVLDSAHPLSTCISPGSSSYCETVEKEVGGDPRGNDLVDHPSGASSPSGRPSPNDSDPPAHPGTGHHPSSSENSVRLFARSNSSQLIASIAKALHAMAARPWVRRAAAAASTVTALPSPRKLPIEQEKTLPPAG